MKLKIINKSSNPLPAYATEGSAGFDICAYFEDGDCGKKIRSGDVMLVPTGLYVEVPSGYELQIRSRSGLSTQKKLKLVNGVGTIDSDYRGEVMIPLINLDFRHHTIRNGERIAQGVIAPVIRAELVAVDQLDETVRGEGGFGSTGS